MTAPRKQDIADQIAGQCLMGRCRKMNRLMAGIYDEELRPFRLKSSQLNLLVAVARAGPVRRVDLGKRLHLDPSTLTRNLRVMLRQGWIDEVPDNPDQRGAPLKISGKGRKLLENIEDAWQRAQTRARRMIGTEGAAFLLAIESRGRPAATE
jgi:DNA-binding MarR family transcriptional regulator